MPKGDKNKLGKEKVAKKQANNGTKKIERKGVQLKGGMNKTHTRYRSR